MAVYDDQETKPDLDGSHESLPMSDEVRRHEVDDLERQFEESDPTTTATDDTAPKATQNNNPEKPTNNTPVSAEKNFYNDIKDLSTKKGVKKVKAAYDLASKWKKGLMIGGGIGVLLTMTTVFFGFLSVFQIEHMTQLADSVFNAQTRRIMNSRAAKHYRLALDGSFYEKPNISSTITGGRLRLGYSKLDPTFVRKDLLDTHGLDVSLNDSGRVTVRNIGTGTVEVLDGTNASNRRRLGEIINEKYEADNWLQRNIRSRTAYKSMGIQRVFFFENTRQKITNWQLEMIKRIRNRLAVATDPNLRAGALDSEGQAEADNLKSQALDNPEFDPGDPSNTPVIDTPTNPIKGLGNGLVRGAQVDGIFQSACEILYYTKGIELATKATRYTALIANAGMIYVAANQIRTGEDVSGEQINAIMTLINRPPGIGASGSYRMMGGDSNATVVHADKFGLSLSGIGGALGEVTNWAENVLSSVTVGGDGDGNGGVDGNDYCRLTRNILYQVGSAAAGITAMVLASIGTGGVAITGVVAKAGTSIATSVTFEVAKNLARPLLIRAIGGGVTMLGYGPSQGGDQTFDAFAGGAMALASAGRYQNGMTRQLSLGEVTSIEKSIAVEKAEKAKDQSVFEKYFALNNVNSSLSMQLGMMPSSPAEASKSALVSIGSLPKKALNALFLFTPQGSANAAVTEGNPYVINNPLALPLYGNTDEDIEESDTDSSLGIIENEDWIIQSEQGMAGYNEWVNLCYPTNDPLMLYGLANDIDKQEDLDEKCTNYDNEEIKRYALYRKDRVIQQNILFMSKASDCTDPDGDDPYCTDPVPGVATTSTSSTNVGSGADCVTTGITEPPSDYSKVTWGTKTVDARTAFMLDQAVSILGYSFTLTQGSYSTSVAASAGSHAGPGAVDIGGGTNGFTGNMQKAEEIVTALRKVGFAAWVRTPENSGFTWHIHANAIGNTGQDNNTVSWMIGQYFAGMNGLDKAKKATDPHLQSIGRPIPEWALKYGSAACPTLQV